MFKLFDRIDDWLELSRQRRTYASARWFPEAVFAYSRTMADENLDKIHHASILLQERLGDHPTSDPRYLVEAFALASLAAKRILGYYPNATQIIAATLLAEGNIVELRSGEGKTLTAFLAAYWLALTGRHVDIATTNDYLARRDQTWLGLAYIALGVEVGLVISLTPRQERRREYAKHVTYVSNQELGFDYLRDNLAKDPADEVSRKHDFVIIDEVDSILIDEARTALIIAEPDPTREPNVELAPVEMEKLFDALKKLTPNLDYEVDYRRHSASLTEQGSRRLASILGPAWDATRDVAKLRALWYALYAIVFLKPDEDYLIKDGRIVLVDEFTGHAMPDRVLFDGLQRAVETKSGVKPRGEFNTIGTITYRAFFQRYRTIAGMTGTAFSAREEFYNLYQLRVSLLRPDKGSLRYDLATRFFRTQEEKMLFAVSEAKRAIEESAPLLMVGRTIASAKGMSDYLLRSGIVHQLLHADVGESEAAVVERAGKPGAITVATNMAGRGADIVIAGSVRGKTGLRVLGLEPNFSRRVDDQLRGRSGRQGQFGETQILASLEDELFQVHGDDDFWNYAETVDWSPQGLIETKLATELTRIQDAAEGIEVETRLSLARFDSIIDHHRNATYTLRRSILTSEQFLRIALTEFHAIFFREHQKLYPPHDIDSLLHVKILTAEEKRRVTYFTNGEVETLLADPPLGGYTIPRESLLAVLDEYWKRYLDNINWLQGWISLTSVAHQDPYVEFAKTADLMFHDMRRSVALAGLQLILHLQ